MKKYTSKYIILYFSKFLHPKLVKYAIKYSENFKKVKDNYRFTKLNLLFEEYLATCWLISGFAFIITLIFIYLAMFLIIGKLNIILAILGLIYAIFVGFSVYVYFLTFPTLAKQDYIKSLEDNLPLALIYLEGLVRSGVGLLESFEIIAKRKEFGEVSNEIKYIVLLTKKLDLDLITALNEASKRTPSEIFKEFLYSIIATVTSGGSLYKTIEEFAKEGLFNYQLKLKEYQEKVNLLLTIYTFIFIAFPLVFIILAFLFSYVSKDPSILQSLSSFFLGFLPMTYGIYLYILYLIQPTL